VHLHIEEVHIDEEKVLGSSNMAKAITNCLKAEYMQEVKMLNCVMSNATLTMMLNVLKGNTFLQKLNLSFSVLQNDDMRAISKYLDST